MVKGNPSYGVCNGCGGSGRVTKTEYYTDGKGKRHKIETSIPHSTCGGTGKIYLGNV